VQSKSLKIFILSVALTLNCLSAPSVASTGKGVWIWRIWEVENGDLNRILSTLNAGGVKWVILKCGDSDSYWLSQGNSLFNWALQYGGFGSVIQQFHSSGIQVFGWHFIYSYSRWGTGLSESDVSKKILGVEKIDGLVVNAEGSFESQGKGAVAAQYMADIRTIFPSSFISYSSFARVTGHEWFPWIEFGRYSDANMPQAYWATRLLTPEEEVRRMKNDFDYWHNLWQQGGFGASVKPIVPAGQGGYMSDLGGNEVNSGEIARFCTAIQNDNYQGVSLYAYHIMTQNSWNEYATSWGGTSCSIAAGQGAPTSDIQDKFLDAYNHDGNDVLGCATRSVLQFTNTFYSTSISGYYQSFTGGSSGQAQINFVPGYPAAYSIKFGFYQTFQSVDAGITNYYAGTSEPVYNLLVSPRDFESHAAAPSSAGTDYNWQPFTKGSMYYYITSPLQSGAFNGKMISFVWGNVSVRYEKEGGRSGSLGLPLYNEVHYGLSGGWDWWFQWFETGFIWFAKQSDVSWTYAYGYSGNSVYESGQWIPLGWCQHFSDGTSNCYPPPSTSSLAASRVARGGDPPPPPPPPPPPGTPGGITVSGPSAGAIWPVGSTQTVTWSSSGVTGSVNIKLSTDGGSTFPIILVSGTANDGTESVTVPNNPSTTCRIRIESASNTSVYGVNPANFTITSAQPTCYSLSTAVSPNGSGAVSANTSPNCTGGYLPGTAIGLTATPNPGYTFSSWTGSGGTFSNQSASVTTFTITGNAIVTASFTHGKPNVETTAATNVTSNGAQLNGMVNPNGSNTWYYFQWGTTTSYGDSSGETGPSNSTASLSAHYTLVGLIAGTTYHYRLVARNNADTTFGNDVTFRTQPPAPSVATLLPSNVTAVSAKLNGRVNPNGLSTDAWFEYGTSSTLATLSSSPIQSVGSGTSDQLVAYDLSALLPNTTYYYRVVAANATGTSSGAIISFPEHPNDFWQETNGPNSVTVFALAVNSGQEIFAGGVGVYRSTDSGANWMPIGLANTSIYCLAINNIGHVFAGGRTSIFRSTDNGNTWSEVLRRSTAPYFYALTINSNGHIFAGCGTEGIYRSTDNGASWIQVNSGLTKLALNTLAIGPGGQIFAGTSGGGGVFRSTDNGESWASANNGITNGLIKSMAVNSLGHVFAGTGAGVFRSTDNGATWIEVNKGLAINTIDALAINTSNYVFASPAGNGVYRSTDNGITWSSVSTGLVSGAWIKSLALNSSDYLFAGTDRGIVYRSVGSTKAMYSMFGRATVNGSGLSGVTLSLTGNKTDSTATDTNGNYAFADLANGSYAITPSKTGYTFVPPSRIVTVSGGDVAAQDFVANAQTAWYVNNLSGSDASDGSPGTPKRTIQAAVASASPGSVISVTNTGVPYNEAVTVSGKALTFTSSGGTPEINTLVVNLSGLASNQISFTGPFKIRTLDLSEGTVQGANFITISSGGRIIRRSLSATLAQRLNYEGPVDLEYAGQTAMMTGVELPPAVNNLTFTRNGNVVNYVTTIAQPVIVSGTLTINNDITTTLTGVPATTGTITVTGNVVIGPEAAYSLSTIPTTTFNAPIVFAGSADQTITVQSAGISIGSITINTTGDAKVTLVGGNLSVTPNINFVSGLFYTGSNVLTLAGNAGAAQGYTRNVTSPARSHVVGNLEVPLKVGNLIAFGRNEFPVGDENYYRPAALTLVNPALSASIPLGISAIVKYDPTRPTGVIGLPILNGVAPGVDIARYPDFSWFIKTSGSLGQTQFNLELTAEGYTEFDDIANVRMIRRSGTLADITNAWSLQGAQYDNYVIGGIPTVVNVNSTGGLAPGGAIYTYGLKSTMVVANPITPINLTDANKTFTRDLTNPALFTGAKEAISYSVTVDNPAIVTATIANNVLTVTQKVSGTTFITVIGTDSYDGSRISYKANVQCVSVVEEPTEILKEFSLAQNYPNPFNPATTISFALPERSRVAITIFNVLGIEVAKLVDGVVEAGRHQISWDASRCPSGVYLCRMQANGFTETRKLILLR